MIALGVCITSVGWCWSVTADGVRSDGGSCRFPVARKDMVCLQSRAWHVAYSFQKWLVDMADERDVDVVAVAPVKESSSIGMCLLGATTCVAVAFGTVPVECPTLGELERVGFRYNAGGARRPLANRVADAAALAAIRKRTTGERTDGRPRVPTNGRDRSWQS